MQPFASHQCADLGIYMNIEKKNNKQNTTHPPPKNTPSRKLNLEPLMTPQEWIDKGRSKNSNMGGDLGAKYFINIL